MTKTCGICGSENFKLLTAEECQEANLTTTHRDNFCYYCPDCDFYGNIYDLNGED